MQPIHWTDDKSSGITIGLYPGIKSYEENHEKENALGNDDTLSHDIEFFGNSSSDCIGRNAGYIIIQKNNKDALIPLLLDSDSRRNSSNGEKQKTSCSLKEKDKSHKSAINSLCQKTMGKTSTIQAELYLQAFEYHQPLRRAFTRAFHHISSNEKPNERAINVAWKMAQNYTKKGYRIYGQPAKERGDDIQNIMKENMGFKKSKATKSTKKTTEKPIKKKYAILKLHGPCHRVLLIEA